jgi:hypothetical protein
LDEGNNWYFCFLSHILFNFYYDWLRALSLDELERSFKEGQEQCDIKALVIINPGNPTGQGWYYFMAGN